MKVLHQNYYVNHRLGFMFIYHNARGQNQCCSLLFHCCYILPPFCEAIYSAFDPSSLWVINHECIMSCWCQMLKIMLVKHTAADLRLTPTGLFPALKQSSPGNSTLNCVHQSPLKKQHSSSLWYWKITSVYWGSTREDYTRDCPWSYLLIIASSIR